MTENTPLACIILAAGQGTRMKSDLPKVLHKIAGLPLVNHVLNSCAEMQPEQIVVVTAPGAEDVAKAVAPVPCVVQAKAQGTGDAVKAARDALKNFSGDVIVLFGADPFVYPDSIRAMQRRRAETNAAVVVAGFEMADPKAYGRLIIGADGQLQQIIEHADATPEQRRITLCNGGLMLFDGARMFGLLDQLQNNNAKSEYYLTEVIAIARAAGHICAHIVLPADEFFGVDSRQDLAKAERMLQQKLRMKAMQNGCTLIDPDTVYLSADSKIGRDVVIEPNVFIGPGVDIADRVTIRAFSHIEKTRIEAGAIIGPFARLRPGAVIGADAHIGNFVEVKNATIGKGAKANHLSYIGDATVGDKTNIGAGTIIANYDGFNKFRTEIGAGASTGANTVLVAPIKLGAGAYTGAGSVIDKDVPADALAIARVRQENRPDYARRLRERNKQKKDGK